MDPDRVKLLQYSLLPFLPARVGLEGFICICEDSGGFIGVQEGPRWPLVKEVPRGSGKVQKFPRKSWIVLGDLGWSLKVQEGSRSGNEGMFLDIIRVKEGPGGLGGGSESAQNGHKGSKRV